MSYTDGTAHQPAPNPYESPQAEVLLQRAIDLIDGARPMPLSASSMINKDEVLEVLREAMSRMPEELRAARWLLKEREDFLAQVRRDGEQIMDEARARAEQMVQRTEVVKSAEQRARQTVEQAEADARRMRHEVEDFCDQKLGSFEIVLERTLKAVSAGRARLQGPDLSVDPVEGAPRPAGGMPEQGVDGEIGSFFDQDDEEPS